MIRNEIIAKGKKKTRRKYNNKGKRRKYKRKYE